MQISAFSLNSSVAHFFSMWQILLGRVGEGNECTKNIHKGEKTHVWTVNKGMNDDQRSLLSNGIRLELFTIDWKWNITFISVYRKLQTLGYRHACR